MKTNQITSFNRLKLWSISYDDSSLFCFIILMFGVVLSMCWCTLLQRAQAFWAKHRGAVLYIFVHDSNLNSNFNRIYYGFLLGVVAM